MNIRTYVLTTAALVLPLVCGAQSDEDVDADTTMTYDGLVQVKKTGYRNVWVKPDADISVYSKIMPGGAQFHYRDVPEGSSTRMSSSDDEFFIQDNSRASLEEIMSEIFREEISDSEYFTLVDVPGRDTALIWGGLHDIVSFVPPETVGRSSVYLNQVGQATLVLQIEDSMSREVLARIVDRRAAESAFMGESSRVTNTAEVRRLARTWARILKSGLDKWHESSAEGE
jgi:hypothetical protein